MNGIDIKKKRLTERQQIKLAVILSVHGAANKFCAKAGVSFPSMKAAFAGKELSEQIINKIIKAL